MFHIYLYYEYCIEQTTFEQATGLLLSHLRAHNGPKLQVFWGWQWQSQLQKESLCASRKAYSRAKGRPSHPRRSANIIFSCLDGPTAREEPLYCAVDLTRPHGKIYYTVWSSHRIIVLPTRHYIELRSRLGICHPILTGSNIELSNCTCTTNRGCRQLRISQMLYLHELVITSHCVFTRSLVLLAFLTSPLWST